MRSRLWLMIPAMVFSCTSISCPRIEDAIPKLERAENIAAPSPAPIHLTTPPPAPPPVLVAKPAAPTPSVEPVALVSKPTEPEAPPAPLPPELVDDGSDDRPDPEDTQPAPPPPEDDEAEELASTAKETWVFAAPSWKSRRLGYLRAGAIVKRGEAPVKKNAACAEGWYRIEPRGYVCVGAMATLNIHGSVVDASKRRPSRDGMPYTYVISRYPPPPLYARLPSREELRETEPDLSSHLRKIAAQERDPAYVAPPEAEPVPGVLLYGRPAPPLGNTWRSPDALVLGHALPRSGFALLSTFDHEGRRYGLTTELAVIPIDRTRVVKPSTFVGQKLDDEISLPVAFVRSKHATRYTMNEGGALTRDEALAYRAALPLTGRSERRSGALYFETRDGTWVRDDQIVRVDRFRNAPAWATQGRKWIDVSILKQSLVAYEGTKPVYVTLVSTGADGLGDPKKTHSTIQGAFLIHTKHVSVTMDDDTTGDEFDLRDVPFVQYFTEGYALHAAYWHDDFGKPRSHGCINLAPLDAAWLFNWTDPDVPAAWHAALSLKKGTLVYTHP